MLILLYLIQLIHLLFVAFVIITPFTNSNYFLLLHVILVPFMYIHWVANNNICGLTVIEQYIRKEIYGVVNPDECFTCQLITPVYDVHKNYEGFSNFIYIATLILWCISVAKLYMKYRNKEITTFLDLMQI